MIVNISNAYYLIKDNIKETFSNKVNIILINPVILLCQCVNKNKVTVIIYNNSKIRLYDAVLYDCLNSFVEGSITINGKPYKPLNFKKI